MSMTAAELFEIVKDVPREAWPSMLYFERDNWRLTDHDYHDDMEVVVYVAEQMLIGSMTAWLAGKSFGCMEITHQSYENSEMRFTVTISIGWTQRKYENTSLVAALAAACKEAA